MTKAATRGEKIRRKRGRPKLEGLREPNGRLSRANEPPHKLAIEARARMLGLTVLEATDPDCHTFIGALYMPFKTWERAWQEWLKTKKGAPPPENPPADCITTKQYDAILKYLELRNQLLKSIQAEGAEYDNRPAWSSAPLITDEEASERAKDIEKRYTAARESIQRHQDSNRQENLWAALDLCIIRGERLVHMVGAIRHVGNALSAFFRT